MVYLHAYMIFPFSNIFLLLFFMLISLSTFYTVLLVAGLRVFSFAWEKEYFGVIFLTGPHGLLRKKLYLQVEFSHYRYWIKYLKLHVFDILAFPNDIMTTLNSIKCNEAISDIFNWWHMQILSHEWMHVETGSSMTHANI